MNQKQLNTLGKNIKRMILKAGAGNETEAFRRMEGSELCAALTSVGVPAKQAVYFAHEVHYDMSFMLMWLGEFGDEWTMDGFREQVAIAYDDHTKPGGSFRTEADRETASFEHSATHVSVAECQG